MPTIDCQKVILCEGFGDASFLKHLVEARNLPRFWITYPTQDDPNQPGGRDGFRDRLKALRLVRGFANVTDILVISDNDDSPAKSFQKVIELVESAGYTAPTTLRTAAGFNPRITVFMLPTDNVRGQLETLCLQSCCDRWPGITNCLDAFIACNPHLAGWEQGKRERMKMRTMISSICSSDPYTSLPHAWSRTDDIIPLGHNCFDDLADFLRAFGA